MLSPLPPPCGGRLSYGLLFFRWVRERFGFFGTTNYGECEGSEDDLAHKSMIDGKFADCSSLWAVGFG